MKDLCAECIAKRDENGNLTPLGSIDILPSVSTEKTGRWIPVSERLPENSGRYLAYIVNKHDDKLQYIMTCDYSVDGYWNWFPDDETACDNVIAWMQLPQPYKEESEVQDADSD